MNGLNGNLAVMNEKFIYVGLQLHTLRETCILE